MEDIISTNWFSDNLVIFYVGLRRLQKKTLILLWLLLQVAAAEVEVAATDGCGLAGAD